jgi:hypothetical protein
MIEEQKQGPTTATKSNRTKTTERNRLHGLVYEGREPLTSGEREELR